MEPVALLHVPGTLFSAWTHMPYTPLFYAVAGGGEPVSPDHEPLEVRFVTPDEAVASGLMAEPDKIALKRAISLAVRH